MPDQQESQGQVTGPVAGLVRPFLKSQLSVLLIILAGCLGLVAVLVTAREEEPQIVVPLADVFVQAPGASAEEVEKLVSTPLERLLWQIDGVEHVYSISRPGQSVVTVRFYVGEDRERSLVKLHNKIMMNQDQAPPLVTGWVIKPVEIDDVPIVTLTLHSPDHNDHQLRRMAEELLARLAEVPDISRTRVVGGRPREVRVELDPKRLSGYGVTPLQVQRALRGADASLKAGRFSSLNQSYEITSDSFLSDPRQVGQLVVGLHQDRPVYLKDVARILDGPAEAQSYTRIGFGRRYLKEKGQDPGCCRRNAVTIELAKKKGTNAVQVAQDILGRVDELKSEVLPSGVEMRVTRNYGRTAQDKSDELMESLFFAVLTVVALLAFTLGWREALVVAFAVPLSFACALFVNYLFGYTINRVTMFALILSLGLVVDDPITNVDNIQRHILLGRRGPKNATLAAVQEVLPPVIMSTLAIIVSFGPMFFITGMMGPYMAPMAVNVPLTVTFSTLWALTVVPWLSYRLLKSRAPAQTGEASAGVRERQRQAHPGPVRRIYVKVVTPFLDSRGLRWGLLALILVLLGLSLTLPVLRQVPLKMLPFDNKNEFQLVLDFPEGTTLEASDRAVRDLENYLSTIPEVTDFTSYVGTSSPMDFNGMVRHYYLRQGGNLADIRVNLVLKDRRQQQSHAIVLRLRRDLSAIASRHGADLKIVEVPPGPPVLSTLVAEVSGEPQKSYSELIAAAGHLKKIMALEPGLVDIDDSSETPRIRVNFVVDKEKAALHGVSTSQIIGSLRLAVSGDFPATIHLPFERQSLMVRVTLPRVTRSNLVSLAQVPVKTSTGQAIPLAELGRFVELPIEQPIYHKDLKRVVYVYTEVAGRSPAAAIWDLQERLEEKPLPAGIWAEWAGEGEWQITLRVFRDLGLAFAAAMVGIYILLVLQTGSFFMPLLLMVAIPLTMLGIMPGFWLLNLVAGKVVAGFADPVFFTATSMIGMIALGGIVIRNSLVLIEFIQQAVNQQGRSLKEAILESGAVRFRPIVLTACTTALGAWPITLDPIFSGLAWALIFGLCASTAFTLLVVPVTYFALYQKRMPQSD
ncbi:MAG: efflux RND transporter permease subunit [Desulfarculaceae bacterium]|jgi:multidrug efflux pump subunit AcrB